MTRANGTAGSSRGITTLSVSFLLATMALPGMVGAQAPATATLTVHVAGIRNAKGKVNVDLYQDAKGFPDTPANAVRKEVVAIDAKALTAEVTFKDLAPGVYAVALLHDENGNGTMDKNFIGIPKEGHGASNNPAPQRRPPTFEEAKFTLSAPAQTLDLKLLY